MKRRDFIYLGMLGLASCALPVIKAAKGDTLMPVLGYHDIRYAGDLYSITPEVFNQQMKFLYDNGFRTTSLDATHHPEKSFVISFDDGYKSYIETAVPIMKEYGFSSVHNIIGEFVGVDMPDTGEVRKMMDWNDLSNLLDGGDVELGSHTYALHHYNHRGVEGVTDDILLLDLLKFDKVMKQRLGIKCTTIAWPYGMYNSQSAKMAEAVGYKHILTSDRGMFDTTYTNTGYIPRVCLTAETTMEGFGNEVSAP